MRKARLTVPFGLLERVLQLPPGTKIVRVDENQGQTHGMVDVTVEGMGPELEPGDVVMREAIQLANELPVLAYPGEERRREGANIA